MFRNDLCNLEFYTYIESLTKSSTKNSLLKIIKVHTNEYINEQQEVEVFLSSVVDFNDYSKLEEAFKRDEVVYATWNDIKFGTDKIVKMIKMYPILKGNEKTNETTMYLTFSFKTF